MSATILAGRQQGAEQAVADAQTILEEVDRTMDAARISAQEYDEVSHLVTSDGAPWPPIRPVCGCWFPEESCGICCVKATA